jgi:hypothetical protein
MNLDYAVERLYQAGWQPWRAAETECLPDGRRFPSVLEVQRAFAAVGLQLAIEHNAKYNCYRATWSAAGKQSISPSAAKERQGTVVGACQREAAVYALAQILAAQPIAATASQI